MPSCTCTATGKEALHYYPQFGEHAHCISMLYRQNQHIDQHQSKQEVDKVDNQVA